MGCFLVKITCKEIWCHISFFISYMDSLACCKKICTAKIYIFVEIYSEGVILTRYEESYFAYFWKTYTSSWSTIVGDAITGLQSCPWPTLKVSSSLSSKKAHLPFLQSFSMPNNQHRLIYIISISNFWICFKIITICDLKYQWFPLLEEKW